MQEFEYNHQLMPQNLLEVDNIGDCGIKGYDALGGVYYMTIQSVLGRTTITTWGPMIEESPSVLLDEFKLYSVTQDYNEGKIISNINKFLNGKTPKVEAEVLDLQDTIDKLPDLRDILSNLK